MGRISVGVEPLMTETAVYRREYFSGVEAPWLKAFPDDPSWNAAAVAIPAKLAVQPELFLLVSVWTSVWRQRSRRLPYTSH
jgi:hypothetical protein